MPRLLVFNPEHDYALAHGGRHYMAPASVRKLASRMQLLPLVWAHEEDYILTPDNEAVEARNGQKKTSLGEIREKIEEISVWGWDAALSYRLETAGFGDYLLPSQEELEKMRRLSHRRISIKCNKMLGSPLIPEEINSLEGAMEFLKRHNACYFKMPWSSGGRGVVTTRELNQQQVAEWVNGCIRRQGSLMAEPEVERVIDFSSLWTLKNGEAVMEGYSISLSDGRGKYDGNLYGPQDDIKEYIMRHVPDFDDGTTILQKEFLEKEIAPAYSGKVGIDMMGDKDGRLYPCVEINLRRTMGHVAIAYEKLGSREKSILKDIPLKSLK